MASPPLYFGCACRHRGPATRALHHKVSAAPRASKLAGLWSESDYGSNVHDVIRFMILFSGMVLYNDDDDHDDEL
ncbi:hypothetical protein LWI29_005334 [Acer saccharum]|uniref:Uncharacterized protein n=1 Tax=Acer saccharum TaxID=4024 RepID=A0AA39VF11_ACESA|nr:hypothetical protein LWI29_005334 [Acer saccharum]